jgi:hypothetical protein
LSRVSLSRVQENGAAWVDFGVLQAGSDLSAVNIAPFAFSGRFGFDTVNFGLDFTISSFTHKSFSSDVLGFPIDNAGGAGAFLTARLPLRFLGFTIEPSILWGKAAWEDGSLYWFLGKPDLPEAKAFGISVAYKNHSAAFYYVALDIDVAGNDDIRLFTSESNGFAGFYTFSFERPALKLGVSGGLACAEGSLGGELTDSNQHYWFFPYIFYRVNGDFYGKAGSLALSLRISPTKTRRFSFETDIATAYIFSSRVSWSFNYKNKNLFDGRVVSGDRFVRVSGIAGIFLRFGVGWTDLPIGKTLLSFGGRKIFIIPGNFAEMEVDTSSIGTTSSDTLKTLLLSGLSFYASWRF